MSHIHNIVDTGNHFVIDPLLRTITTSTSELVLIQGDHNSKRYTFEIPKTIEGHDMSLCNRIEVHYDNISKNKKELSEGFYIADDVSVNGDKVIFSWLISGNVTRLAGTIQFWINFSCTNESNEIVYSWGTDTFKSVQVLANNRNTEQVTYTFPDVLEQWRQEVFEGVDDLLTDEDISKAVSKYLDDNPVVVDAGIIYLESPGEDETVVNLRDLESGVYVLKGTFMPYSGSTTSYVFASNTLVIARRDEDVSYTQIFYPKDNVIQYLKITNDAVLCKDVSLADIESSSNRVTTIDEESDDDHYPSAKAVKAYINDVLGVIENGSY